MSLFSFHPQMPLETVSTYCRCTFFLCLVILHTACPCCSRLPLSSCNRGLETTRRWNILSHLSKASTKVRDGLTNASRYKAVFKLEWLHCSCIPPLTSGVVVQTQYCPNSLCSIWTIQPDVCPRFNKSPSRDISLTRMGHTQGHSELDLWPPTGNSSSLSPDGQFPQRLP